MHLKKITGENKKTFLVTVLQVSLLLMLFAVTIKALLVKEVFYFSQAMLGFVFLKILLFDLKKELGKEYRYNAYFFGPLYLIVQGAWIARTVFDGTNNFVYFTGFTSIVFLHLVFFRLAFGRNFTSGKVLLSKKGIAVVKTGFDIRSFSTPGMHVVLTDKKIREGSTVKIRFKRGFFGKKNPKID